MRITEDRKGRLLETIWELTDRFNAEDDEALGQIFMAITQFAEEAALDERDKVVAWLRVKEHRAGKYPLSDPAGDEWAFAGDWADEIQNKEHLKCS